MLPFILQSQLMIRAQVTSKPSASPTSPQPEKPFPRFLTYSLTFRPDELSNISTFIFDKILSPINAKSLLQCLFSDRNNLPNNVHHPKTPTVPNQIPDTDFPLPFRNFSQALRIVKRHAYKEETTENCFRQFLRTTYELALWNSLQELYSLAKQKDLKLIKFLQKYDGDDSNRKLKLRVRVFFRTGLGVDPNGNFFVARNKIVKPLLAGKRLELIGEEFGDVMDVVMAVRVLKSGCTKRKKKKQQKTLLLEQRRVKKLLKKEKTRAHLEKKREKRFLKRKKKRLEIMASP
ncbi:hypothetical protein G7Y89_g5645 [Cudoniella acicularis]|uniref:Uncharacterized protein n=1 Tax=Cudoniella acicularis TaxID=354080 RepID=A0A8H4RM23_9HELO|nr:hypothetical protein G7Y89_g5645 [Cudoniella acicularis]